ncbi:hypothetical protein CC2G_010412 [Coprinopsis cinerea AmutBmut pab1-1]|nr:hypothetical protein CC2G_010412 [Coprinopsis cinerea AmutBmut pab1-1]
MRATPESLIDDSEPERVQIRDCLQGATTERQRPFTPCPNRDMETIQTIEISDSESDRENSPTPSQRKSNSYTNRIA